MSVSHHALPLVARLHQTGAAVGRLSSRALGLSALARSRRSLLKLDEHLLRDIGLTRAEALAEAERGAWDAPAHWKG
jgi:hypothetical protein